MWCGDYAIEGGVDTLITGVAGCVGGCGVCSSGGEGLTEALAMDPACSRRAIGRSYGCPSKSVGHRASIATAFYTVASTSKSAS